MFDVLDDLETAIEKIAACEGFVDVARISKLAERLDFQRLRAVGQFDRSCSWAAEDYASTASATAGQDALFARARVPVGAARPPARTAPRYGGRVRVA